MKLNRPAALFVALLTLAPWAYMVFFFSHVMSQFATFPNSAPPPDQFFQEFNTIFRLQMLFMAFMLGLMVFYIVHVFRTDRVPADKKALWAVVLFLGTLLAMPFYWYFYMWPKREDGSRLTSG
jgi:VanZ family protein